MKEVHTEIEIEASAERVWQLLTDLASYSQWNPFILEASGEAKEGARIKIRPAAANGMIFKPKIIKMEPHREFRWLGHVIVRGLFDGEHIFLIEPLGEDKVRFVNREIFRGLLVPLFVRKLDNETLAGFEEMNQALKAKAEQP